MWTCRGGLWWRLDHRRRIGRRASPYRRRSGGARRRIEGRHQPDPRACFANVTTATDLAASMCNPPFHASAEDAAAGSTRKRRNLKLAPTAAPLNFGGAPGELWCEGGEVGFIERMIAESAARPRLCFWFTTLVSKRANLPRLERALERVQATQVRTVDMAQGQKQSRILAWTFMRP